MPRALFEKTGSAIWISHLDLMRLLQRAFKRAGLPLTHTQGFNPRPSVSIALPLSVGVESKCELLDFDLEGASVPCQDIKDRLNSALVPGVRVLEVYADGGKLKNLTLMDVAVQLFYDRGVPQNAKSRLEALFASDALPVEKKGKNGTKEQDIIPMIRSLSVQEGEGCLVLKARICCQNPTLNPMQLVAAVERYLPEATPDFSKCRREEIYDDNETIFR